MKQTVNFQTFCNAFKQIRPDNFSYDGLGILFDYLTELENDTGEQLELDVIAICCDFAEADAQEIAKQYDLTISDNEDEAKDYVYQFLSEKGVLVDTTTIGTFVYSQF
jgi:hypothetical protein